MDTSASIKNDVQELRATTQLLMPVDKTGAVNGGYDIYPVFHVADTIYSGFESLASWIISQKTDIVIDGYSGVFWRIFTNELNEEFLQRGLKVNWVNIDQALKSTEDIDELISSSMGGDDPLFGKRYDGQLSDFFDPDKLATLNERGAGLNIVYGIGAALAGWDAPVIYLDVPKNEIQFRSRARKIYNLGADNLTTPQIQYKRFYFVEWPILNRHKKELLPRIAVIVDEQRIDEITWTTGHTLRDALKNMSKQMLRPRPWFEPGVWGGQWIKDHIDNLNTDVVNYAWSFELIAPENGIVIENDGKMLEVSLDTLLFFDQEAVLGKAARRFGDSFPIRFDFLDTFNGGNLSLQCHPTNEYTKANFGENYTQDETYYILDAEPGAEVYLGFQENIDKENFKKILTDSYNQQVPVKVEDHVQVFPATKHDLFLIPNGTVHCSGKNNMVLEISATPYIFTFKMYDWLRPDLNGNPRTLNIDRAFENLNFERKGDVVKDTLISKQTVVAKGNDWEVIDLSTHHEHFYAIERLEFDTEIQEKTKGQCHVLSLVEGENIIVETNGTQHRIHYAETFLVPANALCYTMTNTGHTRAKVIKAFLKDECC